MAIVDTGKRVGYAKDRNGCGYPQSFIDRRRISERLKSLDVTQWHKAATSDAE